MISFRLRTKWQKCRGYVTSYERTPKIPWLDIHSVFATHVETVCLLSKLNADHHTEVELNLDELNLRRCKYEYSSISSNPPEL